MIYVPCQEQEKGGRLEEERNRNELDKDSTLKLGVYLCIHPKSLSMQWLHSIRKKKNSDINHAS